jgi:hypothetical protein
LTETVSSLAEFVCGQAELLSCRAQFDTGVAGAIRESPLPAVFLQNTDNAEADIARA